jgi:hypothetical protein
LAILATGSVRGKIADLVSCKSQAFYGPEGKEQLHFDAKRSPRTAEMAVAIPA